MNIEKKQEKPVMPPPTFDITGLTREELAILQLTLVWGVAHLSNDTGRDFARSLVNQIEKVKKS